MASWAVPSHVEYSAIGNLTVRGDRDVDVVIAVHIQYTHQYQYISFLITNNIYLYLQPPLTRDQLVSRIEKVQTELDEAKIKSEWRSIMEDVHAQSLFMPLYGTRIPYVLNRRLSGFTPSTQAYSIPVNTIQVVSGSRDLTIAPGGMFMCLCAYDVYHMFIKFC